MKQLIFLSFSLLLAGCGANKSATLFLKEKDQQFTDLYGNNCTESGYVIIKAPNGEHYRMITTYSNCDIKIDRRMEEFEPQQWGLPNLKGNN